MEEIKEKLTEIYEKKANELAKKKMYENNLKDYEKQYHEIIKKLYNIKKHQKLNLLIIIITYILSSFTNNLITIELSGLFEGYKYSLLSVLRIIVFIIPIISHISFFMKTKDERELLKEYTQQKYQIAHNLFDYSNLLNFSNKRINLYDESINKLLLFNNENKNIEIDNYIKNDKEKTFVKK